MRHPKRINPRSKPRLKSYRRFTGSNPVSQELPPLPSPSKKEMRTILVGGKEHRTLVKIYPSIEPVEELDL